MSVAFRREGDEEHKEPRFELPIPAGPNRVTRRGLRLTTERVAALEAIVAATPEVSTVAGSDGARVRRELRYWRTRLATAQPTLPPADGSVGFATRVTYRLSGTMRTIEIVGDDEAEPAAGRIAFAAPLVRAMAGAWPGERLDYAGKAESIEIMSVAPLAAV